MLAQRLIAQPLRRKDDHAAAGAQARLLRLAVRARRAAGDERIALAGGKLADTARKAPPGFDERARAGKGDAAPPHEQQIAARKEHRRARGMQPPRERLGIGGGDAGERNDLFPLRRRKIIIQCAFARKKRQDLLRLRPGAAEAQKVAPRQLRREISAGRAVRLCAQRQRTELRHRERTLRASHRGAQQQNAALRSGQRKRRRGAGFGFLISSSTSVPSSRNFTRCTV